MPFDSSSQGDRQDEYLMAKFQEDLVPKHRRRPEVSRGLVMRMAQEGLTLKFPIPPIVIERIVERVFMEAGEGGGGRMVDPPSGMVGSSGSGMPSGESGSGGSGSGSGSGESGSGESGSGSGNSGESGSGSSGPGGGSGSGAESGPSESGPSGSGDSGSGSPFNCDTDPRCPFQYPGTDCAGSPVSCPTVLVVNSVAYPLCACNYRVSLCHCCWWVPPSNPVVTHYNSWAFTCTDCCYEGYGVVSSTGGDAPSDNPEVLCDPPAEEHDQLCYEWGEANPQENGGAYWACGTGKNRYVCDTAFNEPDPGV